jgi:hypothetical protein
VAKKAVKQQKLPPEPNPAAVAAYEAERRRSILGPPQGSGVTKRTPALEKIFLEQLAAGYSVTASAWTIGVHRMAAYRWRDLSLATRQEDGSFLDDFCVRWDDAMEAGVDRLEDEAHRRAARGVEKPVYQGGVMVGTITEYSDTLMQVMLKGKRPSRYNTERHELVGAGGGLLATKMEIEFIDNDRKNKG